MTMPVNAFAREKLVRVLGPEKAPRVLEEVLGELGTRELHSPEDLLRFAHVLEKRGGFEAALGAMLCIQAVLRGARGT